jgi:hypothetical protein
MGKSGSIKVRRTLAICLIGAWIMQAGSRTWVLPLLQLYYRNEVSPAALDWDVVSNIDLFAVGYICPRMLVFVAHAFYDRWCVVMTTETWENQFHETHMIRWRARNKWTRISLADAGVANRKNILCVLYQWFFPCFWMCSQVRFFFNLQRKHGYRVSHGVLCSTHISSFCKY